MLAMLGVFLEGCSSSGGSVDTSVSARSGTVTKGPLEGARVFADANGDGLFNTGEVSTLTDENGAFSLANAPAGANIVVETTAATVDTVTGNLVGAGTTFRAPADATVFSPLTTLLADGADEASIKQALGIPTSVSLLNFNPFDTADAGAALAYEKASISIFTTVKAIQAAVVGAGGDGLSQQAETAALNALIGQLTEAASSGTPTSFNLSSAATITAALDAVAAAVGDSTVTNAINAQKDDISAAVSRVNVLIDTISSIDSTETAQITVLATESLRDQVESATSVGGAPIATTFTQLDPSDSGAVNSLLASVNLAPNDILFSAPDNANANLINLTENNADDVTLGTFTATDPNAGDIVTFSLDGADKDSFTLSPQGVLTFIGNADFETKSSYSITITATDNATASKSRTETFTINVQDEGTFNLSSVKLQASDTTQTLVASEVTVDDVTKLITSSDIQVSQSSVDGFFTNSASPNTDIVFNLADVPAEAGSAIISLTLLDVGNEGQGDFVRDQGERKLTTDIEVSWSTVEGEFQLAVPVDFEFAGSILNDDINNASASNPVSNQFDFTFDSDNAANARVNQEGLISADGSELVVKLLPLLAAIDSLEHNGSQVFDAATGEYALRIEIDSTADFINNATDSAFTVFESGLDIV